MLTATVVTEVGPPLATDEASLASEEFAIYDAALCDDGAFPLPQRPVPAAIGQHHISAVVAHHLLGRIAANATV